MKREVLKAAVVFGLVLAIAGCGSDTSTSITGTLSESDLETEDLAAAAASDGVQDLGAMNPRFPVMGVPAGEPHGCPYDAASGRFVCDPVEHGPFTITRSYAFYDAAGNAQSAFDENLTASMNLQSTVDGSESGDGWHRTAHRERNMTATGLEGAETSRTWNGTSSGQEEGAGRRPRPDGDRGHGGNPPEAGSFSGSCTTVVDNVVVPEPRTAMSWPLSGSITTTMTRSRNNEEPRTVVAVLTFNGTQYATLTIGDETFTVDLARRGRLHRRGPRH